VPRTVSSCQLARRPQWNLRFGTIVDRDDHRDTAALQLASGWRGVLG